MADESKSKGILDSALNLVTNRDEKAALEEVKKHVAELEKEATLAETRARSAEAKAAAAEARAVAAERKVAQLEPALAKAEADNKANMAKLVDEQGAKGKLVELEKRAMAAEAKARLYDDMQARHQMSQAEAAAEQARILAVHTLTSEETLSHLSLKYYGHATEPYWRLIYEANKELIGANPNKVRAGLVLNIPALPDDMKK